MGRRLRACRLTPPPSPPSIAQMTFQIFVGGQRVNSDRITSTPAWAGEQVRPSRGSTLPPPTTHARGTRGSDSFITCFDSFDPPSDARSSRPSTLLEQAGASRKRTCEDPSEPSAGCKRQQGAQDAAHVLQQVTNHAGVAK